MEDDNEMLFEQFLQGVLTPEEMADFKRRLNEDSDFLDAYSTYYLAGLVADEVRQQELVAQLTAVENQKHAQRKRNRNVVLLVLLSTLVAGLTIYLLNRTATTNSTSIPTEQAAPPPSQPSVLVPNDTTRPNMKLPQQLSPSPKLKVVENQAVDKQMIALLRSYKTYNHDKIIGNGNTTRGDKTSSNKPLLQDSIVTYIETAQWDAANAAIVRLQDPGNRLVFEALSAYSAGKIMLAFEKFEAYSKRPGVRDTGEWGMYLCCQKMNTQTTPCTLLKNKILADSSHSYHAKVVELLGLKK